MLSLQETGGRLNPDNQMGARFGAVTAVLAEEFSLLKCYVFRLVNSFHHFEGSSESISPTGLPVPSGFFGMSVTIY